MGRGQNVKFKKAQPPPNHNLQTLSERNYLRQGFSNFFVSQPFPNIFKISATLKYYKLQQIKGKRTILGDLGNP
jgi:hypothetical protein